MGSAGSPGWRSLMRHLSIVTSLVRPTFEQTWHSRTPRPRWHTSLEWRALVERTVDFMAHAKFNRGFIQRYPKVCKPCEELRRRCNRQHFPCLAQFLEGKATSWNSLASFRQFMGGIGASKGWWFWSFLVCFWSFFHSFHGSQNCVCLAEDWRSQGRVKRFQMVFFWDLGPADPWIACMAVDPSVCWGGVEMQSRFGRMDKGQAARLFIYSSCFTSSQAWTG